MKYDHASIEKKWQSTWFDHKLNVADVDAAKKPFYNLMMFPYPSAEGLHVGNMYAFTGSDIYGRFKRMQGYDVFEPIGLDGFGIHSENFALKIGRHPMEHAEITQKNFYNQLKKIGSMFDWEKTVETYDPDYYRWTQWLFIQMFKHGLAYRGRASVNWCPSCKTVLADEQVIEGKCERCGNTVEKRLLDQWFFRITAYAEKLLGNLPSLDWSEKVKVAQTNWIGKKEGINITYAVVDEGGTSLNKELICFTTTPVNFAATFIVIAPEHPFISEMMGVIETERSVEIANYIKSATEKSQEDRITEEKKKTGVFTGFYAKNHVTGENMPIWISDFVIMGVGTGAVQGCPGHDVRDFDFATQFGIPIKRVVVGLDGDQSPITKREQVIEHGPGKMIHSDFLNGMEFLDAMVKTMDYFEEKGWGKRVTTYHLRDWLISRQRYWGPPIPMIYCKTCAESYKGEREEMPGYYTVPEAQLPVVLPRIDDYKPENDGVAPLAKHKEFFEVACPGCGNPAVRETDVSDTFLDSSWYFLRYPSTRSARSGQVPFDSAITKKWLPVDMYTGGAEHSVLHLMYARFVTMTLHDFGYLDFEEPFSKFYAHGLVIKDGAKMSKSKGNVVNPDEYIQMYGSDALRLYLMFMGPFSQGGDFRDAAMEGMHRWVGRIWRMVDASIQQKGESSATIRSGLQKAINDVSDDMEKRRYNTAIATLMEWTNLVGDEGGAVGMEELKSFIKLLAPFAPHLAEEVWSLVHEYKEFKIDQSIHVAAWPVFDASQIVEASVTIAVQVSGKLRDTIVVSKEISSIQNDVETIAKNSEKAKKFLDGQTIRKTVFIPGKIINFVV